MKFKPLDTPMSPIIKLVPSKGATFGSWEVLETGWKIELSTITSPDISSLVNVVTHFLNSSFAGHWNIVICILKYIEGALGKRFVIWTQ